MRVDLKKISVIFAFGFAITGLIFFIDLFFAFLLGNSVRYEEPNKIIAAIELVFAVLSFIILTVHFLGFSRESPNYSLR